MFWERHFADTCAAAPLVCFCDEVFIAAETSVEQTSSVFLFFVFCTLLYICAKKKILPTYRMCVLMVDSYDNSIKALSFSLVPGKRDFPLPHMI